MIFNTNLSVYLNQNKQLPKTTTLSNDSTSNIQHNNNFTKAFKSNQCELLYKKYKWVVPKSISRTSQIALNLNLIDVINYVVT